WGVKMVLPLPRNRFAAFTATLPSTWSLASMSHHLRETSLALAEKVFIRRKRAPKLRTPKAPVNSPRLATPASYATRIFHDRTFPFNSTNRDHSAPGRGFPGVVSAGDSGR